MSLYIFHKTGKDGSRWQRTQIGVDKMGISLPYAKVTFVSDTLKRRSWACPTSQRLELYVGDVLLIQLCKPSMA